MSLKEKGDTIEKYFNNLFARSEQTEISLPRSDKKKYPENVFFYAL